MKYFDKFVGWLPCMRGLTLGAEKDWFPDSADWFGWDTFKVTIIIFHDFIKNKNFEMIIFDWFFRFISKAGRKKLTKTSKNPPCFRTSLSEGPVRNSDFWSISSDSLSGNSMSESRDLFCTDPRRPYVIDFQIFQNFESYGRKGRFI